MPRSRHRLADFEARSVQTIAACSLGLAGMSSLQAHPAHRMSANVPGLSTTPFSTESGGARSVPQNSTTTRSGRS